MRLRGYTPPRPSLSLFRLDNDIVGRHPSIISRSKVCGFLCSGSLDDPSSVSEIRSDICLNKFSLNLGPSRRITEIYDMLNNTWDRFMDHLWNRYSNK